MKTGIKSIEPFSLFPPLKRRSLADLTLIKVYGKKRNLLF
jgi:hypothetical protein